MNCIVCSREVELWHSYCPHCQNELQPRSYSTITDSGDTRGATARRRVLRKTLQFSILAFTLIVLASIIRFTPPKANPSEQIKQPDAGSALAATEPAPVVGIPESTTVAEVPEADSTPTPTVVTSPSLSTKEKTIRTGVKELSSLPAKETTSAADKSTPVVPEPDEAVVKKLEQPLLVTAMSNNAVAKTAVEAEPSPRLEVESSPVILGSDTGLVTIKSYNPARVYINGVYSGVTPRTVKLLTGTHVISLMADGYYDYTRQVKVSGQQQLGILASMSRKDDDQR